MGSFQGDIDLRVNMDQRSVQQGFDRLRKQLEDVTKGVAGAGDKAAKTLDALSKTIIDGSTRAGRQLESQLKSIERQTAMLGKSAEQRNEVERKWMLEKTKGLKNEEEQVKRINRLYDQRRQAFQEEASKAGAGEAAPGTLLLRGARDIFEGRMAYGTMDIGRAIFGGAGGIGAGGGAGGLAGISGAALGIGGLATALLAVEAAGMKAAKSLGEYGTEIQDVQLRTGLTAREVGQFSFAAKVVGQDVSITERMMRGLAQAADDTSMEGDKARKVFERLHITLADNMTGAMKPTAQVLEEIGIALGKLPAGVERVAAARAMFNRVGVEAIPFITELTENLKIAREQGYGPSEEEITRFKEYQRTIAEVETNWSEFMRTIKEPLAITFNVTLKILGKTYNAATTPGKVILDELFGGRITPSDIEMGQTEGGGYGDFMSRSAHRAEARAIKLNDQLVAWGRSLEENKKLVKAQKELETLQSSLKLGVLPSVNAPILERITAKKTEIKAIKDAIEAENQFKSDQKAIVEALRKAHEDDLRKPLSGFELPAEIELRKVLEMRHITTAQAAEFTRLFTPRIEAQRKLQGEKLGRQMLEMEQTVEREISRARLGGLEPVNIRQLGEVRGGELVTRADVERDITAQYQQRMDIAMQTFQEEYKLIKERKIDARDTVALAQQDRDIVATTGKLVVAQIDAANVKKKEGHDLDEREREQERRHREEMSKIQLADQEESIKHDADLGRRRAELRFKGDNPAAGIAAAYKIAVDEAQQLYDLEVQRIALFEKGDQAEEDRARALHKLHREDEAAREEAQLKLAEMQQQQLDTLKGKIEPLYQTLFTQPSKFGQQLRQTVQEAALHPIVSGMSEVTSRALYPLIYGATGTGGLAGSFRNIFGGGRLNDVQLINGSVPVHVTGVSGGGGRAGGYTPISGAGGFSPAPWFMPPGLGPGGTAGFAGPGGYMPPVLGTNATPMGGGVGGYSWFPGTQADFATLTGGLGPGGTAGFTGPVGFSGGTTGGTGRFLQSILGGGGQQGGGIMGALGGLFGRRQTPTAPSVWGETPGGESMGRAQAGPQQSIGMGLARAGAGTVGMMLAQQGLLGQQRGTAGGVFEGMFGGAGIGFAMGGPLGAAIGAAAGLAIGLGEMIAGVESPRNEAKRLAQSFYHISINNTTADQIVNIANQSYGGRVSIAVRSPEVRHMLGLYAAGTGQAGMYQQSLGEPHGASLVESGGTLFQQATYQYGNPYSYGSSLPVYGGSPTHVLGAPGGGISLSLNVGGQDAAKFLQGNVITPDVVQTQYANAMYGSSGRVPQALMMSEPGAIAS
jgi:hypothetical protein